MRTFAELRDQVALLKDLSDMGWNDDVRPTVALAARYALRWAMGLIPDTAPTPAQLIDGTRNPPVIDRAEVTVETDQKPS
jgi:hypothetical protein